MHLFSAVTLFVFSGDTLQITSRTHKCPTDRFALYGRIARHPMKTTNMTECMPQQRQQTLIKVYTYTCVYQFKITSNKFNIVLASRTLQLIITMTESIWDRDRHTVIDYWNEYLHLSRQPLFFSRSRYIQMNFDSVIIK